MRRQHQSNSNLPNDCLFLPTSRGRNAPRTEEQESCRSTSSAPTELCENRRNQEESCECTVSAPTTKSPQELERWEKMIEIWTEQGENQFHFIHDDTLRKKMIANHVKTMQEEEEKKQAKWEKLNERERAQDKAKNTGDLDRLEKMRAIWTEKAEKQYSGVPNPDFKRRCIENWVKCAMDNEKNKLSGVSESRSKELMEINEVVNLTREESEESEENVETNSNHWRNSSSSISTNPSIIRNSSSSFSRNSESSTSSTTNEKEKIATDSSMENNSIVITRKGNEKILIPQQTNEHVIITCNDNDGLKIQCKRKRSRGGKRVRKRLKNQGKQKNVPPASRKDHQAKCDVCQTLMPSGNLSRYARTRNPKQFHMVKLKNMNICPSCITTSVQQRREAAINNKLMQLVMSAVNTVSFTWPFKIETVNLTSATNLLSFFGEMKYGSSFIACTREKRICSLTVDPIVKKEDFKSTQADIIGGKLPQTFDFKEINYNTLKCPANADFGVIKFSNTDDFLIIGKLNSRSDDVLTYGRIESEFITKNVLSGRSGEASGLVYPDTNSKSLCDATKKNKSILLERKKSLGCSVYYDNAGEKKSYNSIFNQIKMQRLSKRRKNK